MLAVGWVGITPMLPYGGGYMVLGANADLQHAKATLSPLNYHLSLWNSDYSHWADTEGQTGPRQIPYTIYPLSGMSPGMGERIHMSPQARTG